MGFVIFGQRRSYTCFQNMCNSSLGETIGLWQTNRHLHSASISHAPHWWPTVIDFILWSFVQRTWSRDSLQPVQVRQEPQISQICNLFLLGGRRQRVSPTRSGHAIIPAVIKTREVEAEVEEGQDSLWTRSSTLSKDYWEWEGSGSTTAEKWWNRLLSLLFCFILLLGETYATVWQ